MHTKNGDIMLFKADDRWISRGIALLTHSDVSHSAMVYPDSAIVEMGPHGIQRSQIREDPKGEEVYLLRLKPARDPQPLVQAAARYLAEGVAYDFPDLVILAGLLIYRAVRPTPRWAKITDLILNYACAALDQLLNRLLHKGKKVNVMMCSQFVYQCYLDCGKDYEIILKDALLQEACGNGTLRLIDVAQQAAPRGDAAAPITSYPGDIDVELLSRELYEALVESAQADASQILAAADLGGLVPAVQHFLDLLEEILEASGVSIPLPAVFVAPCDLLTHAENLEVYGNTVVSRISESTAP